MAAALTLDAGVLNGWPLPKVPDDGDKEDRGAVLVIAGSVEIPGAAWLAALAALRAGAGKLTVATVASIAPALAMQLPEARVIALPQDSDGAVRADAAQCLEGVIDGMSAVLVGPGMQGEAAVTAFVARLMPRLPHAASLLLDAQAMSALTGMQRDAASRPAVLMTPHAGEAAYLLGVDKEAVRADVDHYAGMAAERWNGVVALKGAHTCIAAPDGRLWRHENHCAGLATSGSGDVLAGVICGLVARGAALEQAAAWGVALHAHAGGVLSRRIGPIGFLARELLDELPGSMVALAAV